MLRGLQTEASVHVRPFPLATLRREVVPQWTLKETVLAYMCLGGIPYYWRDVPAEKGFRRAINDICCTSKTIFLGEWKEILATEFRTDAVHNLARLFPALMSTEEGVTQADITEKLGVDVGTVARMLDKVVSYGYVLRCVPESDAAQTEKPPAKNQRGTRYLLADFFFTFTTLSSAPWSSKLGYRRSDSQGLTERLRRLRSPEHSGGELRAN